MIREVIFLGYRCYANGEDAGVDLLLFGEVSHETPGEDEEYEYFMEVLIREIEGSDRLLNRRNKRHGDRTSCASLLLLMNEVSLEGLPGDGCTDFTEELMEILA